MQTTFLRSHSTVQQLGENSHFLIASPTPHHYVTEPYDRIID